jgi:Skp family chaperone for outer membrane proteins
MAFALSSSAEQKNSGIQFASIDMDKAMTEFKGAKTLQADLAAMEQKFAERLARRDNAPFLPEEDHKKLDELTEKEPGMQSADDKKKIEELKKKGQDLSEQVQRLRMTPDKDLKDADKEFLKKADMDFLKAKETFQQMRDQLNTKLNSYRSENADKLLTQVKTTIAKVAEQKGVSIVLNSQVALYAGIDLTSAVVSELNKK